MGRSLEDGKAWMRAHLAVRSFNDPDRGLFVAPLL